MISESEKNYLKTTVLIPDILLDLGYRTDHKGYMYYSPFREEASPSFSYDIKRNLWFDHGAGVGGDNIELLVRLKAWDFKDAVAYLKRLSGHTYNVYNGELSGMKTDVENVSSLEILNVSDSIRSLRLCEYASSRGIDIGLMNRYCKEITYRNGNNGTIYKSIGFPNNAGGYVLRGPGFKGVTQSGITTINMHGQLDSKPSSKRLLMFEGFFNFLSYLALNYLDKAIGDVLILNSTTNAPKAVEYISSHTNAEAYLDNDKTGRKCLSRLQESCPGTRFWDASGTYAEHNDLNECLIAKRQDRCKCILSK